MTSQPDDYDYREEGESLFEWPLTILPPRFGDVVVDRGRRTISAVCLWKRKPSNDSKEV